MSKRWLGGRGERACRASLFPWQSVSSPSSWGWSLYLKGHLSERHMSTGSRDMIGAIMGLLSLLLALVLAILVGSAHEFFTSQKAELESLGSRSLELELAFRQYGPETDEISNGRFTSTPVIFDAEPIVRFSLLGRQARSQVQPEAVSIAL
jgi:hypothetical protein